MERRSFYPGIQPFNRGRLKVSALHEIYFEECGNPHGKPVVVLHGGPGGGISPFLRQMHDPAHYRIVLFDQRGCGHSTPHAELEENTTWHLVADIEALRNHLKIARWQVVGGSWGSTLALAYAVTHTSRVLGLVLRGIFLVSKAEIQWFYQEGASRLFPDAFDRYIAPIPEAERGDLVNAFYKRLTGTDETARIEAARAWARWEGQTLSIKGPVTTPPRFNEDDFVDAFARIECHYFVNEGFFETDNWLLHQASLKLQDTPGVIVHGRYDVVTPLSTAWALSKAWPRSELHIVPDAGHSSMEPGIIDRLVQATDDFADKLTVKSKV